MDSRKLLKWIVVGSAIIIFVIALITAIVEEMALENDKPAQVEKKRDVYPASILQAINDLENSKETKQVRYKLFDEAVAEVIPFKPSDADLAFHKKFVLSDYKKITFEYVQTLPDTELLKMIYRNRPVDMYYVDREIYDNPLAGVAFNVIQIAREQYQGTLNKENYDLYKVALDNHFKNIK